MSVQKQNWIELTSIQLGGAICLPVILIGHELTKKLGAGAALFSIIGGNLLLFGLALIASQMSVQTRLTTAENAEKYFGRQGKLFFALIIAFSLSCWFAIQTEVMSHDLAALIKYGFGIELQGIYVAVVLAVAMIGCALFGLQGVTLLANATLPLMIITLFLAVWQKGVRSPRSIHEEIQFGEFSSFGFSLILAAAISAVVDLPTFFRHAKTKSDGAIAACLIFLLGIPLVEIVGVLLGFWATNASLTDALFAFDHPLFKVWIGLFILFAGWTTNNTNIYSANVSLQAAFPKLTEKKACLAVGALSLGLSLCPLLEHLSLVLDVLGVCIASMGGVVLTAFSLQSYFGEKALHEQFQKISWLFGAFLGFMNIFLGGLLSQIAIIDALFGSSLCLIMFRIGALKKDKKELIYET